MSSRFRRERRAAERARNRGKKYIPEPARATTSDRLVVYGATCTWWGMISDSVHVPGRMPPGCPHCKGVLFQMDLDTWNKGIKAHAEKSGDVHYQEFVQWLRGQQCIPLVQGQGHTAMRERFNLSVQQDKLGANG